MHHAANIDISALPLDVLDIRTDCALCFHVDAPYLHAEIVGIDRPVVWIGPDGYEVGHRIEWGATCGEVAVLPVANFGGVERWHVFAGGGASFANTDFSVLPADTIVSCVNDSDPRVTSMELVFDTSLSSPEYDLVAGTAVGLPLATDGTEYELEIEVTPERRDPVYRRVSGTVAETVVNGEGIGVSYEETLFNLGYSGEHRMKVAGAMPKMGFRNQHFEDIPRKLVAVREWSDLTWNDTPNGYERAFYGCQNFLTTGRDVEFDGVDWVPVTGSEAQYLPAPEGSMESALRSCTRYGDPDRVGTDCDIGDWDVSGVIGINFIFGSAESFNQDLAGWNTANITDFTLAFLSAFNYNNGSQPLDTSHPTESGWDMSSATALDRIFQNTSFNQPVNGWTTDSVVSIEFAFSGTPFNQPVDGWNTANVTDMQKAFLRCSSFDQCVTDWDWTAVEKAKFMFSQCDSFNNGGQPFDVNTSTALTNVFAMFKNATSFNQPVSFDDTSQVQNFGSMFQGATSFNNGQPAGQGGTFTLDIGTGRTSADVSLYSMFRDTNAFNQAIGTWDTSNVISIYEFMRRNNVFNQDIGSWDVSNVTDFRFAFEGSAFNQDVSSWQIDSLENGRSTFENSGLSQANYEAILIGWEAYANTPTGVDFSDQAGMEYAAGSAAETARQNLINNDSWTITGDTAV